MRDIKRNVMFDINDIADAVYKLLLKEELLTEDEYHVLRKHKILKEELKGGRENDNNE